MPAKQNSLTIKISGDTKKYNQSIKDLEAITKKAGGTIQQVFTKVNQQTKTLTRTLVLTGKSVQLLEKTFIKASGKIEGEIIGVTKKFLTAEERKQQSAKKTAQVLIDSQAKSTAKAAAKIAAAKRINAQVLTALKIRTDLEKALIQNAGNSIIAIKARQAAKEKAIAVTLANSLQRLAELGRSTKTGRFVNVDVERARLLKEQEFGLRRIAIQTKIQLGTQQAIVGAQKAQVAATQRNVNAQKRLTRGIRNSKSATSVLSDSSTTLLGHIFRIVAGYRLINALINESIRLIKSIPKAGIQLQTTEAVLDSTLGSSAATASAFSFLEREASRTGIAINVLRENFRNLQASMSLAGEVTDTVIKVFTNLNTVSTTLHLSAAKTVNLFNAISQIFNKSKVQSEELVKQLGNLLPGAFASFAAANKKSTQQLAKDLEQGLQFAHDSVLNFTEFLAERFSTGFALASVGLQSNIGRLQTSFTLLGEAIFNVSKGSMTFAIKTLTSLADTVRNSFGQILSFAKTALTVLAFVFLRLGTNSLIAATGILRLTTATKTYTGVALIAAQATRVWVSVLAFFSAPATIIAGLLILANEFINVGEASTQATDDLKEFIEARKEINELLKNPITAEIVKLDIQIDNDRIVTELRDKIDATNRALNQASDKVISLENAFVFRPGQIEKAKREFRALLEQRKIANKLLALERKRASKEIIEAKEIENKRLLTLEEDLAGQTALALKREADRKKKILDTAQAKVTRLEERVQRELNTVIEKSATFLKAATQATTNFSLAKLKGILPAKQLNLLEDASLRLKKELIIEEAKLTASLTEKNSILVQTVINEKEVTLNRINGALEQARATTEIKQAEAELNLILEQQNIIRAEQSFSLKQIAADEEAGNIGTLQAAFLRDKANAIYIEQLQIIIRLANQASSASGVATKQQTEDIKKATQALELLGKKGTEVGTIIKTGLQNSLANSFESVITGAKSAKDAFGDFAASVLKQIAAMIAKTLALVAVNALLGIFTGGTTLAPVITSVASADGNVIDKNKIVPFRRGGIPDVGSRKEIFALADGGIGSLREEGPEAILPLKRNSSGELGVEVIGKNSGNSGGNVYNINIQVESTQNEDPDDLGRRLAISFVRKISQEEIVNAKRSGNVLNKTTVFG